MKYTAISTMFEGLSLDNGYIPLDDIEKKLRVLSEEELWEMGSMNSAELPWRLNADKAGLTQWERTVLAAIMELAFGEAVTHDCRILL